MMRSKTLLACLMAGALSVGLGACGDDDSGGNNNHTPVCGDNVRGPGEQCDGDDLVGETCSTLGLDGGDLACAADCTFDLSGCTGCGNGVIEMGENCDGADLDGETCASQGFSGGTLACNATCDGYDTSGCNSGCPVAAQDVTASVGATVIVDTSMGADDFTGSCSNNSAPDELLSFVAPDAVEYIISTANPGTDYDTLIFAFTDCMNPTNTELACNDDTQGLNSEITVTPAAGETVYLVIDGYNGGGTAEVSILPLICGDGIVAGTEQCDDGNTTDGDGCASDCTWECTDDANEDSDNEADAVVLSGGSPWTGGGVLCPDDTTVDFAFATDWFKVNLPAGQALDVDVTGDTLTDCTQQDLGVQFFTPELNELLGEAFSDGTNCLQVTGVAASEATDILMVFFSLTTAGPPQDYQFTLTQRAIVCGDGVAEGDEACDDGNTVQDDGCQNDCTLTPLCNLTADQDLGALASGTGVNETVDLTAQTNTFPSLPCALAAGGGGGEDYMYAFSVSSAGTLTIDVDHTGGDVLYGLYSDDGSCTEVDCFDIYPAETDQLTASVTAGNYVFLVQAIGPGAGASVSLTFTAP